MEYNFLQQPTNPTCMHKYQGPIIIKDDPFLNTVALQDHEDYKLKSTLLAIRAKIKNPTSFIAQKKSNDTENIEDHDIAYLTEEEAMSFINNPTSSAAKIHPHGSNSLTSQNDVYENQASSSTEPVIRDSACSSSQNINEKPTSCSAEPVISDSPCSSSTKKDIGGARKRPASITVYIPDKRRVIAISKQADYTLTPITTESSSGIATILPSSTTCTTGNKHIAHRPTTSILSLAPTTSNIQCASTSQHSAPSESQLNKIRLFSYPLHRTYTPPSTTYTLAYLFEILKLLNKTYPTISYSQEYTDFIIGMQNFGHISAVCKTGLGSYGEAYEVSNPIAKHILRQIDMRIEFAAEIDGASISVPHTYSEVLTLCIITHMDIMKKRNARPAFICSEQRITFNPAVFRYFQYNSTDPLHLDLSLKIGIVFLHELLLFLYFSTSQDYTDIFLNQNMSITLQMFLQTLQDHNINIPDTLSHSSLTQHSPVIQIRDAKWLILQLEELLPIHHVSKLNKLPASVSTDNKSTYKMLGSTCSPIDLLRIKDLFAKAFFYTGTRDTKILLTPTLQRAFISFDNAISSNDQQDSETIDDGTYICQEEKQELAEMAKKCATHNLSYGQAKDAYIYIEKHQSVAIISLIDKVLQHICFSSNTTKSDTKHSVILALNELGLDGNILYHMQNIIDHNLKHQNIILPIRFVVILRSLIRVCREFDHLFPFYIQLHPLLNANTHVIGKQGQRLDREHALTISDLIFTINEASS